MGARLEFETIKGNAKGSLLYAQSHSRFGCGGSGSGGVGLGAAGAGAKGLGFTILKDPDNRVADYLGASVTPEAYLFAADWTLRYHGRIDDSRDPAHRTTRDLSAALDAVAAGKPVAVAETKAFGCTIKRIPRS